MTETFSRRQRFILKWLAENEHHKWRWMREGRNAFGPPETWDTIEISGHQKRIRIKRADFEAISPHVETTSDEGRIFKPVCANAEAP